MNNFQNMQGLATNNGLAGKNLTLDTNSANQFALEANLVKKNLEPLDQNQNNQDDGISDEDEGILYIYIIL